MYLYIYINTGRYIQGLSDRTHRAVMTTIEPHVIFIMTRIIFITRIYYKL